MSLVLPVLDPASAMTAARVLPPDLLDDEALACVAPEGNSRQWIDQLVAAGYVSDATRIIAVALPRKYALAWACECLKAALAHSVAVGREVDRAGVALAERWLGVPTEEHRRAALDFAERGNYASAGAWISAAAGWAEGNIGPRELEHPVVPAETLTGEAVAAALLTLALADSDRSDEHLRNFVARALTAFGGVAEGAVA